MSKHPLSYVGVTPQLPEVEDIRALLAGKQYFDNDYSPSDFSPRPEGPPEAVTVRTDGPYPFLGCACHRTDCPRCGESRRAL